MGLGLKFPWQRERSVQYLAAQFKKKIEELEQKVALLEGEKLLALAVLESMSEAVIAVDSSEKILFINLATERLFQLEQEKIAGKNLLEAIRNARLNDILLKTLRQNHPQSEEMEMLTPIFRFFQIQTASLAAEGKPVGAIAVLHDVTRLKQLEQGRKEFVANVSHELKTPLASIRAAVETLLEGALEDPNHNRRFLETIQEDTGRLSHLIEDLLDLARIESREIPLQKQKILCKDIIEKILQSFQKSLQQKNISVEVQAGSECITADPEQLRRAVGNLIDNAVKYNKPNGKIWIRTKTVSKWLQVEVEDTGIGIPEQDLPRIFERFYRVDKARSRDLGGTGLGLSIVKHIAEAHGGKVEVTSQIGKGSCFTLALP